MVDNVVAYLREEFVGRCTQSAVMPSVEITARSYDCILVSARIAHHAHRPHRQQDGACLPYFVVEAFPTQPVDEYLVGLLRDVDFLWSDFSEHADSESRPGKGWRPSRC